MIGSSCPQNDGNKLFHIVNAFPNGQVIICINKAIAKLLYILCHKWVLNFRITALWMYDEILHGDASHYHGAVIKWKHFPRYWPFVWGIHRSPVNSSEGQWRGALMFSLICAWMNGWVNNGKVGDLRPHDAHHDVIVMTQLMCDTVSSNRMWCVLL